jgi:predicted amino acid dehydrogenase
MAAHDYFALIGHPPDIDLLHQYMEYFKPSYKDRRMNDDLLCTVYGWMPPFNAFDILTQHPHTSRDIQGVFILATFLPELVAKSWKKAVNKVKEAIELSEQLGAKVVALGGFASIIDGHSGQMVAKAAKSTAVTNGSTMTIALTIEGIKKICALLKIDLSSATVAVIGATGSIGRTCAQYFLNKTAHLILTGRKQAKLASCFSNVKPSSFQTVELTTDNRYAAGISDIVICVTSSVHSIFLPDHFKTGAVVCDVGFPKTVSKECADREDIIVYRGGLAQMPWPIDHSTVWGLDSKTIAYGCFAEAMVIAMEGCYQYCTVGLEDISLDRVEKLMAIAQKHGFQVAPFANSKRRYGHKEFEHMQRALERSDSSSMAV